MSVEQYSLFAGPHTNSERCNTSRSIRLPLENADVVYYPNILADHYKQFYKCYEQLKSKLNWQQDKLIIYGKSVAIPRLNAWYSDKNANYAYSGMRLNRNDWCAPLLELKLIAEQVAQTSFNSVLANYYRDARDSVAWHSDDEPELGPEPIIASLNFGEVRRFSLRQRHGDKPKSYHIDLESGSLLLMRGMTQRYWHHQVPKVTGPGSAAVKGRINLTFRQILNTQDND